MNRFRPRQKPLSYDNLEPRILLAADTFTSITFTPYVETPPALVETADNCIDSSHDDVVQSFQNLEVPEAPRAAALIDACFEDLANQDVGTLNGFQIPDLTRDAAFSELAAEDMQGNAAIDIVPTPTLLLSGANYNHYSNSVDDVEKDVERFRADKNDTKTLDSVFEKYEQYEDTVGLLEDPLKPILSPSLLSLPLSLPFKTTQLHSAENLGNTDLGFQTATDRYIPASGTLNAFERQDNDGASTDEDSSEAAKPVEGQKDSSTSFFKQLFSVKGVLTTAVAIGLSTVAFSRNIFGRRKRA